jgi:hypothetical protein
MVLRKILKPKLTEKFSQLSEEKWISGMGAQKVTEKFSQRWTKGNWKNRL